MVKVYISGKITGTTDYMERFKRTEDALSMRGFTVVNPARVNAQLPEGTPYGCYMEVSLAILKYCDAIYMMDGWEDSVGAKTELDYAKRNKKMIVYQSDGSVPLIKLRRQFKKDTKEHCFA